MVQITAGQILERASGNNVAILQYWNTHKKSDSLSKSKNTTHKQAQHSTYNGIIHFHIGYSQTQSGRVSSNGQTEQNDLHYRQGKYEQHHTNISPHAQEVLCQ